MVMKGYLNREMTEKIKHIWSFSLVIVVFFIFQLFYFNRFLPIQDGWFIEYAKQISSGKVIYKDFQVFVQPIYVFIFSWVSDFFGNSFITFRYYGLFERTVLIGVIYLLFSQIANAFRSAFLVLLGMFLFVTCTADVIYSYYQLVAIFVFLSAYFVILSFRKKSHKALILAGLFSGLAFLTKQSTGTLVPVALILTIGTLSFTKISELKSLITPILLFICGFVLPIIIMIIYIWHLGALDYYFDQVFGAAASKGKLSHALFSFWAYLLNLQQFFQMGLFFMLVYGLHRFWLMQSFSTSRISTFLERGKLNWSFIGLVFLVAASLTPWFVSYPESFSNLNFIYTSVNFFVMENMFAYACIYFNGVLVIYYFHRVVTKTISLNEISLAIISVTSFAFMWGHGLSGFIEPHATLISSGLLFGWLLSTEVPFNILKNAMVYVLIIFIIVMCSFSKASWMYSWWGWDDRISWTASRQPNSPLLKGFYLNDDKAEIIDGITKAIQDNSDEGDAIFTFPHMPMFYLLGNRPHDTFSAVHYFDVCSDELAKSDAKIVASTKPKVILYMDIPESGWKFNEDTYRGGARSGQREIKELIEGFKRSGEYKTVRSYTTSGYGYKIEVLVKD